MTHCLLSIGTERVYHAFYLGNCQLGDLNSFEVNPASLDVEHPILRLLGDSPFMVGKSNLTSLLEKAYEFASDVALEKAMGDTDGRESEEKEEEA